MNRLSAVPALSAAGLAWALLTACLGGSDGVENPKMELRFAPGNSQASAGQVRLYSKYRNPARDSLPLLAKSFSGSGAVSFTSEEMDKAIARELRLRGVVPKDGRADTVLAFNVVASTPDREALVAGFRYLRQGSRAGFARVVAPDTSVAQGAFKGLSETYPLPLAVLDFKGRLGKAGAELGIDYVFIPGSPYLSTVDANRDLAFQRLPQGIFGLVGADQDSSLYFSAADSLNTADTAFVAKSWDPITFIRQ